MDGMNISEVLNVLLGGGLVATIVAICTLRATIRKAKAESMKAEAKRDAERNEWERTRVLALFAIQPYAKSNLQAHDVLPFPWDEKQEEKREEVSKDEFNARFEAAKKRYGLK